MVFTTFLKLSPKILDLITNPESFKCLGTRSPQSAQFVAKAMLAKLEDYWLGVRLKRMECQQLNYWFTLGLLTYLNYL